MESVSIAINNQPSRASVLSQHKRGFLSILAIKHESQSMHIPPHPLIKTKGLSAPPCCTTNTLLFPLRWIAGTVDDASARLHREIRALNGDSPHSAPVTDSIPATHLLCQLPESIQPALSHMGEGSANQKAASSGWCWCSGSPYSCFPWLALKALAGGRNGGRSHDLIYKKTDRYGSLIADHIECSTH